MRQHRLSSANNKNIKISHLVPWLDPKQERKRQTDGKLRS